MAIDAVDAAVLAATDTSLTLSSAAVAVADALFAVADAAETKCIRESKVD